MKAVIYSRVSSQEQSTNNQVPVLEAWAKQRDYEVVDYYVESESAWRNGHQRELARLVDDARKRKFDIALVWALDRLSREGAAAILNLIDTFKVYGVRVVSYQESWTEAPGAIGEVLYAISGWVAKMESQRRSERTKAGIERKRREGFTWGRPKGVKDKRKRKHRRTLKI